MLDEKLENNAKLRETVERSKGAKDSQRRSRQECQDHCSNAVAVSDPDSRAVICWRNAGARPRGNRHQDVPEERWK